MSKSSDAADSEGASSSGKEEIIRGLNEDLAREYKAIIQYVVFSSTLKGAEYGDIAEQLKQHASQELAHALEVARQIDYLGGDPTVKVKDAEYSQDSKKMLEIDLKQEQETIKSYRENSSSGTGNSPSTSHCTVWPLMPTSPGSPPARGWPEEPRLRRPG